MTAIVIPGRETKPTEGLAVITYNTTDAAIAELKGKYAGLKIIDGKSYETVRLAIADLRGRRTAVEDRRKELKAGALDYGRRVDNEAKRITNLILEIETPLQAEKKAEDDKKEKERAERARKEKERVDGIRNKIFALETMVSSAGRTSKGLAETYAILMDMRFDPQEYQEFYDEAVRVHAMVVETIEKLYAERLAFEQEQAELEKEKAKLKANVTFVGEWPEEPTPPPPRAPDPSDTPPSKQAAETPPAAPMKGMEVPFPWTEKINQLSIHPDAATRHDVARLATELMEARKLLFSVLDLRNKDEFVLELKNDIKRFLG